MKYISGILVIFVLCVAIMITGCTQTGSSTVCPTTTPCSCPSSGTTVTVPTLVFTTEPTQVMPDKIAVIVNVEPKDYNGQIPVTFGGGNGQPAVKNIEVVLTRVDGSTETATLLPENGASVIMNGTDTRGFETAGADRVQVYVHMYSGDTFKVADVLRADKERA